MKNHTCFSSLIALILSLSSFQTKAQHLDLFNDPHLDSTLIKQFGIKSLIVYSDYAEEGFEESNFSITSKWKEIAFNEKVVLAVIIVAIFLMGLYPQPVFELTKDVVKVIGLK